MGIGAKTVQHTIAPTLRTQPGIYNMTPLWRILHTNRQGLLLLSANASDGVRSTCRQPEPIQYRVALQPPMRPGRGYAGVASSLEWRSKQRHPDATALLRCAGRDVGNGTGRRGAAERGIAVWEIRLRHVAVRADATDRANNSVSSAGAIA